MSVRAWPGVVTVGLLAPGGPSRTEVVIDARDGRRAAPVPGRGVRRRGRGLGRDHRGRRLRHRDQLRQRDRAGPLAAPDRRRASPGRSTGRRSTWRSPRAASSGSSPVTALQVINLADGTERTLSSPLGSPFSGTLAMAADGAVLFASSAGVTAYSGSTGGALWTHGRRGGRGDRPGGRAGLPRRRGRHAARRRPADRPVRATVPGSAVAGRGGGVRGPGRGGVRP